MKICNVVGARPQFIKYFPIYNYMKQIQTDADIRVEEILIHTGQHYDYNMSRTFFDAFGMKSPDFHLEVGSGRHGAQIAEIIRKSEEVFLQQKPDVVCVYGDTNSTLGAALAAAKLNIPLAHIEAGLRSFNRQMPEEINRVATDHMSDILFCPCRNAVDLLTREGFSQIINSGSLLDQKTGLSDFQVDTKTPVVVNTGDVMYDVLLHVKEKMARNAQIMKRFKVEAENFALLTLHRAENTNSEENFRKIVTFVNDSFRDTEIIFPIHPRTRKVMKQFPVSFTGNVKIIEPMHYFDLVALLMQSRLLLTDSGGMQKEAYWLGIPCITLREQTEWPETIESGWNTLYRDYTGNHHPLPGSRNVYGDGFASLRIIQLILNWLNSP